MQQFEHYCLVPVSDLYVNLFLFSLIILSLLAFSLFFIRIVFGNVSAWAAQALVTCFDSAGCAGNSTSNISPRDCCVGFVLGLGMHVSVY